LAELELQPLSVLLLRRTQREREREGRVKVFGYQRSGQSRSQSWNSLKVSSNSSAQWGRER